MWIKEVSDGHLDDDNPHWRLSSGSTFSKHQMVAWSVLLFGSSLKLGQLGANFNLIAIFFFSLL